MKSKMQRLVEAADECWHKYDIDCVTYLNQLPNECVNCGFIGKDNPSPDDIKELFRLVKKLFKYYSMTFDSAGFVNFDYKKKIGGEWVLVEGDGNTPAEALLNALIKAIGE